MVALNFSPEFAPDVESGRKTQTIRETARVKPGQRVQLYTGQRTKACRKLGEGVCTAVTKTRLTKTGAIYGDYPLSFTALDAFAQLDGFQTYTAMWRWFYHRYRKDSFIGYLIRWEKEDSKP